MQFIKFCCFNSHFSIADTLSGGSVGMIYELCTSQNFYCKSTVSPQITASSSLKIIWDRIDNTLFSLKWAKLPWGVFLIGLSTVV